jgi:hypothetical protein
MPVAFRPKGKATAIIKNILGVKNPEKKKD